MSDNTARTFYVNFIHSYLTYGIHIYYNLAPQKLTNDLFLLQKKALRLINRTRLKDRLPTNQLCIATSILSLPKLATYFTSNFALHILTKRAPNYILQLFPSHQHNYSRRNLNTLPSSSLYNSLNRKIVTLFNSLPSQIRAITSTATIKRHLKNHFFHTLD